MELLSNLKAPQIRHKTRIRNNLKRVTSHAVKQDKAAGINAQRGLNCKREPKKIPIAQNATGRASGAGGLRAKAIKL